jgi:hypothetical protein
MLVRGKLVAREIEMAKSAEQERRESARRRADRSRRKAAEMGKPRSEWVDVALRLALRKASATVYETPDGCAYLPVNAIILEAIRILVDERGCDRKQALRAISLALGKGDLPARAHPAAPGARLPA